jgi:GntR family transcriptional repressor for pyruvate dehydrogenase complex
VKKQRSDLRHGSRAETVAAMLRARIVDGEVSDGEKLPKLESLIEEFGVSKPTMRESLRILEAEGLITVQRGKLGGSVVHRPRAQNAAYSVGLILRAEQVALGDLAFALQRLEPSCAALCAEREDRATTVLPALEAVHAEAAGLVDGDADEFMAAAGRFHTCLVECCGNATMIIVAGALESIWMAHTELLVREGGGRAPSRADRTRTIALHERILDKVRAGDAEGAYRTVHRHLAYAQTLPLAEAGTPIQLTALHGLPAPTSHAERR